MYRLQVLGRRIFERTSMGFLGSHLICNHIRQLQMPIVEKTTDEFIRLDSNYRGKIVIYEFLDSARYLHRLRQP